MATARIEIPEKLIPVFTGPADVRGAYGGRGSGKTRSFAKMAAVRGYIHGMAGESGIILCARQFMNSLDDSSLEECKRAIDEEPFLKAYYEVGDKYIKSRDGRVTFAFAGLDRNIASIKSKGRILLCWVDEAEPVTDEAWTILIPTLREEGDGWNAELWVTWNPRKKTAPVESRFRNSTDPRTKVVALNWRDNPKFPGKLERDRQRDLAERPDQYDHIWEGGYISVVEGAYFAKQLTQAKAEGRIGKVAADPLLTLKAFVDIGGTGAKADNFVIVIEQWVGREIRVLDHYEQQGQPVEAHLLWLRSRGYVPGKVTIWLPHDGDTQDKVHDVSYRSAFEAAGYAVEVVPNQGKGAATLRIEAVRRAFPAMWFNEETTQALRDALGWYHEKRDQERGIGLGPNHDWASHSCFHPHTQVLTRYGTCRIMDLPETGEVLTPCGWKQYISPRITKKAARLVEVEFADGYSVKCTPDHLFLTVSGWRSAESLTKGSLIRSSLTSSRSTSKAISTVAGHLIATTQKVAADCIATLGSLRSGRSLRAAISTTEMVTCQTTVSRTWNALTPESICESSAMDSRGTRHAPLVQRLARKLLNGTGPQKAANGTSDRLSVRSLGQSGKESRRTARSAELSSKPWSVKAVIPRCIAALCAKSPRIAKEASKTSGLLRIERVKHLAETSDVWDITVPDGHWFSLVNGAVVHNCDAFGLGAVVYEKPTNTPMQPLNYRSRVTA